MATDKIQIGLRVPEHLREKIQAAANQRGVAVNKEISDRLEKSFNEGMTISAADGDGELYSILRVVAAAMDLAGPMAAIMSTLNPEAGKTWISNSIAYEQALQAAAAVLDALKPQIPTAPHPNMSESVHTLGTGMATAILEEAATGLTRTPPTENARAQKLHAGLGSLAERIARFDARKPGNDPGPMTVRLMAGGIATLGKHAKKKGKAKMTGQKS
jgi:Arc-like DNA binding domain